MTTKKGNKKQKADPSVLAEMSSKSRLHMFVDKKVHEKRMKTFRQIKSSHGAGGGAGLVLPADEELHVHYRDLQNATTGKWTVYVKVPFLLPGVEWSSGEEFTKKQDAADAAAEIALEELWKALMTEEPGTISTDRKCYAGLEPATMCGAKKTTDASSSTSSASATALASGPQPGASARGHQEEAVSAELPSPRHRYCRRRLSTSTDSDSDEYHLLRGTRPLTDAVAGARWNNYNPRSSTDHHHNTANTDADAATSSGTSPAGNEVEALESRKSTKGVSCGQHRDRHKAENLRDAAGNEVEAWESRKSTEEVSCGQHRDRSPAVPAEAAVEVTTESPSPSRGQQSESGQQAAEESHSLQDRMWSSTTVQTLPTGNVGEMGSGGGDPDEPLQLPRVRSRLDDCSSLLRESSIDTVDDPGRRATQQTLDAALVLAPQPGGLPGLVVGAGYDQTPTSIGDDHGHDEYEEIGDPSSGDCSSSSDRADADLTHDEGFVESNEPRSEEEPREVVDRSGSGEGAIATNANASPGISCSSAVAKNDVAAAAEQYKQLLQRKGRGRTAKKDVDGPGPPEFWNSSASMSSYDRNPDSLGHTHSTTMGIFYQNQNQMEHKDASGTEETSFSSASVTTDNANASAREPPPAPKKNKRGGKNKKSSKSPSKPSFWERVDVSKTAGVQRLKELPAVIAQSSSPPAPAPRQQHYECDITEGVGGGGRGAGEVQVGQEAHEEETQFQALNHGASFDYVDDRSSCLLGPSSGWGNGNGADGLSVPDYAVGETTVHAPPEDRSYFLGGGGGANGLGQARSRPHGAGAALGCTPGSHNTFPGRESSRMGPPYPRMPTGLPDNRSPAPGQELLQETWNVSASASASAQGLGSTGGRKNPSMGTRLLKMCLRDGWFSSKQSREALAEASVEDLLELENDIDPEELLLQIKERECELEQERLREQHQLEKAKYVYQLLTGTF